jgi:hypothetical protein
MGYLEARGFARSNADEAETQTLRALGIAKRSQPDSTTKSE